MSYYNNPYFAPARQSRRYHPAAAPEIATAFFGPPPPHGPQYGYPHQPFAAPPFPFPPQHEHYENDIDQEEEAAIAHLRAIQRRRESERLARQDAAREAALAQYHLELERAQVEAQARARTQAKAQAQAQAALRARAQAQAEAERQKQAALAEAQREGLRRIESAQRTERQYQLQQQLRQQERRLAEMIAAPSNQDRSAAFMQDRQARRQSMDEARRQQCARQCARRSGAPVQATQGQDNHEVDAFNRWIGSLFGLQLPTESESQATESTQSSPAPAPAAPATRPEKVVSFAPSPVPTASTATPSPAPSSAPAPAATSEKKEFPAAINDLLSTFLGLRVEPESKLGEAVSNKVPAGLNEFLNQFGLEFSPDQQEPQQAKEEQEKVEKKDVSAGAGPSTTKAPAPAPTQPQQPQPTQAQNQYPVDLADYLSGARGLPPFVRDILGNVEQAFKERSESASGDKEVEGKGKGVAEGEKKTPTPAPTPAPVSETPAPAVAKPEVTAEPEDTEAQAKKASAESFAKLDSIASELHLAKDTFTFPSSLCFATGNTESAPSLLYNKQNKPYHAQTNKLLQLLLQADGVASNGDKEVRRKRKELVKLVEGEIEALERKRDEYWSEVKERRENTGEVSENESWTTGSSVDHEHDREHDEVVHVEDVDAPAASTARDGQQSQPDEHPASFADAVKSTPAELEVESHAEDSESKVVDPEPKVSEKVEKEDKEEGYEVL